MMMRFVRSRVVSISVIGVAVFIAYVVFFMRVHAQQPLRATDDLRTAEVDSSSAVPMYANFARVTGTPEEIVVDFGLNTATIGKPVKVNHQVVMNYFTAKRLAMALQVSVARHEKAFGPIETDINKRLRGAPEAK